MPPVCPTCHKEFSGVSCECGNTIAQLTQVVAISEPTTVGYVAPEPDATKPERDLSQAILAQLHDQEWIGRTVHHLQSLKMRATGFHGPNDRCGESIPNLVGMPYPCGALIGGKQRFCNRCAPSLVSWDALPWQMKEGYSTSMVELLERTESYVKSKMDAKSDTA